MLEGRIKKMGSEWAYKQLLKAYEQIGKSLTPENLKILNEAYQRVNHLFFAQLGFDIDLKKEQFFSGEIQFSSVNEIEAFAEERLGKALSIASKCMPVYTQIYRLVDKSSRSSIKK